MAAWSVQQEGRVLVASLTAPGSLDEAALDGLDGLLERVERDDSLRALVLTGMGSTFCIGLDLDLLGAAFGDHDYFSRVVRRVHALLRRIEVLAVPVIAAVNGTARAGGFELMLACDLVLVSDSAKVADHHLHFGILPGGGASARLPRAVGRQRAREILMTARWLVGPENVEAGLALRSVEDGCLLEAALELAGRVEDKPRHTMVRLKRLLDAQDGQPLDVACELELQHFRALLDDEPLADEGYRAFVERREPRWRQA